MGGLRVDEEEAFRGGLGARDLGENGEAALGDAFTTNASSILAAARGQAVAASMDSEFSSITSQTKSVQQINEENRRAAAAAAAAGGCGGGAAVAPPIVASAAGTALP